MVSMPRARRLPALLLLCFLLAGAGRAAAAPGELPLPTFAPAKTRDALLRAAENLVGTPYLYGGENRSGLDCSGYLFLIFKSATGRAIPRTAAEQGRWVLPIPRRELVPGDLVFFDMSAKPASKATRHVDHVGIYIGDNAFLHAASAGSRTGVVQASLADPAWAARFAFAGRALPASALSGAAIEWGLAATFDAEPSGATASIGSLALSLPGFRGAGLRVAGTLPLGRNFSVGLEGRAEWDSLLGVFRFPAAITLGQNEGFSVFAGPALTVGAPSLPSTDAAADPRSYEAVSAWLASAGIRWTPIVYRSGATSIGLGAELRYDRYRPAVNLAEDQPDDQAANRRACFSLSVNLRIRSIHY
jgi:probable lipoprotein NlpC